MDDPLVELYQVEAVIIRPLRAKATIMQPINGSSMPAHVTEDTHVKTHMSCLSGEEWPLGDILLTPLPSALRFLLAQHCDG